MRAQKRDQPFRFPKDQIERVREVFETARFDQASVAETCGAAGVANLPEVTPQAAALRASGDSPLHILIRLFVIGLPCSAESVKRAIAPAPVEAWIAGGLLLQRGDRLVAAVKLAPLDGLLLAFDRVWPGQAREFPDHVMGPSNSARTLANAAIPTQCDDALDLGTGCGYLAFLLAQHSRRVTATDINPRAAAFARFNAALNGLLNVEVLAGDRFAPVEGRAFDLMLSNPPFIISPENRLTYLTSGMKSDEFSRAIAAEAPRFLRPGGYFQMLCNWVQTDGQDWTEGLRGWFEGGGCDAWVLRSSSTDPLSYALEWMAIGESGQEIPGVDRLQSWLRYFDEGGIKSIGAGIVTMRRREGENWYHALEGPAKTLGSSGAQLLELFRIHDLMRTRDDAAVFGTVFAVSPAVRLAQECRPGQDAWELVSASIRAVQGLAYIEQVDNYVAELVSACDGRRSLSDAVARTVTRLGWEPSDVPQETADIVRQLVDEGFLVPRD